MTVLQVDPEFAVQEPPVRMVHRPKYAEVVAAIVAESGCTEQKANQVYQFLARVRDSLRIWREEEGYQDSDCQDFEFVYHLTDADLDRYHDVLDLIMPDDTVARDGSAFALLNRRLLRGNELTFVHTKVGELVVDCAVSIHINTAA